MQEVHTCEHMPSEHSIKLPHSTNGVPIAQGLGCVSPRRAQLQRSYNGMDDNVIRFKHFMS
jgi:hypothetical protein